MFFVLVLVLVLVLDVSSNRREFRCRRWFLGVKAGVAVSGLLIVASGIGRWLLSCADGFQHGTVVAGAESQCFGLFQELLVGIGECE